MGDQPFWARRLEALGAAHAAIPAKRLAAEPLARALSESLSGGKRRAAAALSRLLSAKDGVSRAIEEFERIAARGQAAS